MFDEFHVRRTSATQPHHKHTHTCVGSATRTPPPKHKMYTQQRVNRVTAVHSGRETPGPIPNPEAKPASADDTTLSGGKVGHRRTQIKTRALQYPLEGSGICVCRGVFNSESELKTPPIQLKRAGVVRLFSNSNKARLRSSPPPYPVRLPFAPITRWHGTMIDKGFAPLASPTARDAVGWPMRRASST